MYRDKFVLSIIHDGYPVKETGRLGKKEVAIPFGSEYKIRLKNKNDRSCTARVFIDGKKVSALGDIIIAGGGSVDLERYIDRSLNTGRKFKFVPLDHSDVDDPSSSKNGIIRVEFRKAKSRKKDLVLNKPNLEIWEIKDIDWDEPSDCHFPFPFKEDNNGFHTSGNINRWYQHPIYTSSGDYSNSTGNISPKVSCHYSNTNFVSTKSKGATRSPVESGATVEGTKSHQSFVYSNLEVEDVVTILTLKLVGLSNKRRIYDVRYCSKCGKSTKRGDKYCSSCGHRL